MSGTQHSEHSQSQEANPGHEHHEHHEHHEGDVATDQHHEGHPSHGVPPSFANPLGEAPMEDLETSPIEGATVDALEVAGALASKSTPSLVSQDEGHIEQDLSLEASQSAFIQGTESLPDELVTPTTQVTVLSVDKWMEDYKVRVETLQQEIEALNIRLDQITAHKAQRPSVN